MASVYDLDEQRLRQLGRSVMRVLEGWGVDPREQLTLLGLPADAKPRALAAFSRGTPLPSDPDVLARVQNLLRIHEAVQTLYPHTPIAADYWATTPNAFFSNKTPVEVMLAGGLEGMKNIREHLNGTGEW